MADISVTAGSVATYSDALIQHGTAGAAITAGQAIYKDASDGYKCKPADADASLAAATVVGVAVNNAADKQPVSYIVSGGLNPGGAVVVGETYYASPDAGGIQPKGDLANPDYVSKIGIGQTTSRIDIKIHNSGVQVPAA